jgi:hypothetical protein
MASSSTVNERTDFDIEVTLADKDGDPLVPTDAYYNVYDEASETVIRDWTAFSVNHLGVATIHITNDDLDIVDDSNATEKRILTIHAIYSGGREVNEQYEFRVKNLVVIPKVVAAP